MANRPNILALASKISLESMTYTGITYKDPEYRILEPIVDDDMCSVMMRMRLEKEFSAAELAKKCKKSVEFVQEQCDKLVNAGVIRVRYRGEESAPARSALLTATTTPSGCPASWRASSPIAHSAISIPIWEHASRNTHASALVCLPRFSATALTSCALCPL